MLYFFSLNPKAKKYKALLLLPAYNWFLSGCLSRCTFGIATYLGLYSQKKYKEC